MTLTKRPGVTYQVQSAGRLQPGQPDSFSASTTTVHFDDTILKVYDNHRIGGPAPDRFLRVVVPAAP